jgi:hypothetical protein
MATVVSEAAPLWKAAGFRKRRHGFNRTTESGLVQVVNFQMGPFEPPGSEGAQAMRKSLGLAGNLYGTFTLNLGVYVSDMVLEDYERQAGWVNEYNCQLRMRIGELLAERRDIWWSLDDPDVATRVAIDALQEAGLPWLDHLKSRDAILEAYERVGRFGVGLSPAGPIRIAWLLRARDPQRAEAIFRAYLEEPRRPAWAGHARYLEKVFRNTEFGHLLDNDGPPA